MLKESRRRKNMFIFLNGGKECFLRNTLVNILKGEKSFLVRNILFPISNIYIIFFYFFCYIGGEKKMKLNLCEISFGGIFFFINFEKKTFVVK